MVPVGIHTRTKHSLRNRRQKQNHRKNTRKAANGISVNLWISEKHLLSVKTFSIFIFGRIEIKAIQWKRWRRNFTRKKTSVLLMFYRICRSKFIWWQSKPLKFMSNSHAFAKYLLFFCVESAREPNDTSKERAHVFYGMKPETHYISIEIRWIWLSWNFEANSKSNSVKLGNPLTVSNDGSKFSMRSVNKGRVEKTQA